MSEELDFILRKAEESIRAAALLDEAMHYGFAASRAYYAMFYTAEALLSAKGFSFSTHKAVIAAFGEHFAKPRLIDPAFHQHVIKAFEKRQTGDYDFAQEVAPDDAKLQIDRAKAFLEAARQWLASREPT